MGDRGNTRGGELLRFPMSSTLTSGWRGSRESSNFYHKGVWFGFWSRPEFA